MTKYQEINNYLNRVNEIERKHHYLTPHYKMSVSKVARTYIIVKIDNYYYRYNNMLDIIYDLQFTRNQKSDGVYINYSRTLADLLITE